jgi:ribosomal protein S18 acetylase RimI-like enzyme
MSERRVDIAAFEPEMPPSPAVGIVVRAAVPADADAIAAVDAARNGVDPDSIRPLVRKELDGIAAGDRRRFCAVAVVDAEVVAYGRASWRDHGPEARSAPTGWYLTGVVVSPPFRRRGIGLALTRYRLHHLRTLGADEVRYFTNARNRASMAMHAGLGFEEVTRDFVVPDVSYDGGVGVLFRLALTP